MNTDSLSSVELHRIYRMLRELAELAEHASITGFLQQGKRSAIQRYNGILAHLERSGLVPDGLFQALGDDAEFDQLNIESKLLAGFIEEDAREARRGKRNDIEGVLEEVQQLQELKESLRESMPELLERRGGVKEEVMAELQELRELRASLSEILPGGAKQADRPKPAPTAPKTPAAERAELEKQLAALQQRLTDMEAATAER